MTPGSAAPAAPLSMKNANDPQKIVAQFRAAQAAAEKISQAAQAAAPASPVAGLSTQHLAIGGGLLLLLLVGIAVVVLRR